jgi:hypothetical protein
VHFLTAVAILFKGSSIRIISEVGTYILLLSYFQLLRTFSKESGCCFLYMAEVQLLMADCLLFWAVDLARKL